MINRAEIVSELLAAMMIISSPVLNNHDLLAGMLGTQRFKKINSILAVTCRILLNSCFLRLGIPSTEICLLVFSFLIGTSVAPVDFPKHILLNLPNINGIRRSRKLPFVHFRFATSFGSRTPQFRLAWLPPTQGKLVFFLDFCQLIPASFSKS